MHEIITIHIDLLVNNICEVIEPYRKFNVVTNSRMKCPIAESRRPTLHPVTPLRNREF